MAHPPVQGDDPGTSFGVEGTSQNGYGVLGTSVTSLGVLGTSDTSVGVTGHSGRPPLRPGPIIIPGPFGPPPKNTAGYGVTILGKDNAGVLGQNEAAGGFGVLGISDKGYGVFGVSGGFNAAGNLPSVGVFGGSGTFDAVVGETLSDAHAGVTGRNLTGGANGGVGIYGKGGKYAGKFDGDLQVNGNAEVTLSLNVKGDITMPAGDFAENFPVDASDEIEPGTVMALDENGVLRPSDKSYDRKVVGVISGAGDYRPGLILDRQKSSLGRLPVALVGKVYCKVDATYSRIEIGDLLTTSPTAGHAMKADNLTMAFGAVIGKALGPLESG